MISESSDLDIDLKVEILKKKYLERRNRVSDIVLQTGDDVEKTETHDTNTRKKEDKKSPRYREMKRYSKALKELFQAVSNHPKSISGSEEELRDQTDSFEETCVQCSETDITLPSNLVCTSNSCETEPEWLSRRQGLRDQMECLTGSPAAVGQVYQEMLEIYEKLQAERLSQQAQAAALRQWEQQLQQREARLLQHHSTICRLRGVEGEVIGRVHTLQQQYQQEIETLRSALKEKTNEYKRIKSSFASIKELNDTMKKQLNDVTEQNQRLEIQSRKVQARLDNLQRKYEYSVVHKRRENIAPKSCDPNPHKQDRPLPSNKASKALSSISTVKLLAALLDWVVDGQLARSEEGKDEVELEQNKDPNPSLQERCCKVLPLLVEQLQQVAKTESSLQFPLLRFTYYSLTQLEHSTQHPPLTSTLRRLGEEVSRGPGEGHRSRPHPLFKSSCLHTRFLSTLIILKTVSQGYLPSFLQTCSTEQFFRSSSVLLRSTRLDLALAEKLIILLQKLSIIRKNKRLFEAFSLHLLLQEMHRTTGPAQAFLTVNLGSILLNLGLPTRP
ncbi:coiled-coil domain-containing protein 138 isoform X2 [Brachyhypopomus gauderio]|uniref:coiled-coil domain-containing protein 138 isoform X2 n=1 Tax=Brachyhypopomus gauderio TaxID=698409 RepID=UPI004041B5CE